MGLFNFFKKSEQKSTAETPAKSSWDSTKEVAYAGDREDTPEGRADRIKRQGDKILAAYLYDPTLMANHSIKIDESARTRALEDLQSGVFSEEKQSQILQNIALPSGRPGQENYGPILAQISGRQPAKILAFATLGPAAADSIRGSEVTIDARLEGQLKMLLQKCPTPIEFAAKEEAMMKNLRDVGNTNLKLAEYEDSFEHFKEAVYGKRYEYFQALGVLKDQALQHHLAKEREADRPRREAELRQLQTPAQLPPDYFKGDSYASPEQRAFYGQDQAPTPDTDSHNGQA